MIVSDLYRVYLRLGFSGSAVNARCANHLACLLQTCGALEEAGELFARTLAGYDRSLGASHADTLTVASNLGRANSRDPPQKSAMVGGGKIW